MVDGKLHILSTASTARIQRSGKSMTGKLNMSLSLDLDNKWS